MNAPVHIDWNGNKCFECWKCEPCCGSPCNVGDGLRCCLCWWLCAPCSLAKLWAHSLGEECAVINHCCIAWFCAPCVVCCTRSNLRRKAGVGGKETAESVFDCLCGYFCSPCTCCQMLRSVNKEDWDWTAAMSGLAGYKPPLNFMTD